MTIRTGGNIIAGGFTEELLQTKANLNLDNSTAITNCITSIPQDIKLELNNGTLTLKAGSKVYVPNGVGVFEAVTINNDLTQTVTTAISSSFLVVYMISLSAFWAYPISICFSGATQPTGYPDCVWYDTTNNIVKVTANSFSTYETGALPIAVVSQSSSGVTTSIDQVFNGFGYIGSTDFILPNVKCIETLGKNPDGSYITRVFTNTEVRTSTLDSSIYGNYWVGFNTLIDGSFDYFGTYLNENVISETQPSYNNVTWFNPLDGKWNYVNNGLAQLGGAWQYAIKTVSAGKITSWKLINNTFKALNYWDKPIISGWAMPSDRYIDLTVGASGSQYTAPANGWFTWYCNQNNNGYIFVQSSASLLPNRVPLSSNDIAGFIPVKQGDIIYVEYNNLAFNRLRFIYAEGVN